MRNYPDFIDAFKNIFSLFSNECSHFIDRRSPLYKEIIWEDIYWHHHMKGVPIKVTTRTGPCLGCSCIVVKNTYGTPQYTGPESEFDIRERMKSEEQ